MSELLFFLYTGFICYVVALLSQNLSMLTLTEVNRRWRSLTFTNDETIGWDFCITVSRHQLPDISAIQMVNVSDSQMVC